MENRTSAKRRKCAGDIGRSTRRRTREELDPHVQGGTSRYEIGQNANTDAFALSKRTAEAYSETSEGILSLQIAPF